MGSMHIKRGSIFMFTFLMSGAALLMATLLGSSDSDQDKFAMLTSSKEMKQELLRLIPLGTHIDDARKIMEANGFKCTVQENESFAEVEYDRYLTPIQRGVDFLYCDREIPIGYDCVRRYQIALVNRDGSVGEVFVSIGLICP